MNNDFSIKYYNLIAYIFIALGLYLGVMSYMSMLKAGVECDAKIYMELVTAISLAFSGVILVVFFNNVVKNRFLITPILIVSFYLLLNGIGAKMFYSDKVFGMMIYLLPFALLVAVFKLRADLKHYYEQQESENEKEQVDKEL